MAGTLAISDEPDLCWLPAGWIYDNVLEQIATVLSEVNLGLAKTLLEARTMDRGGLTGGFLDLREASKSELDQISCAADVALRAKEELGPDSFYDPSYYPGFIEQFRELTIMLGAASSRR